MSERRLLIHAQYGSGRRLPSVPAAVDAGLDSTPSSHVQMAVDEACTNIIDARLRRRGRAHRTDLPHRAQAS
jgi:hypothetical protein